MAAPAGAGRWADSIRALRQAWAAGEPLSASHLQAVVAATAPLRAAAAAGSPMPARVAAIASQLACESPAEFAALSVPVVGALAAAPQRASCQRRVQRAVETSPVATATVMRWHTRSGDWRAALGVFRASAFGSRPVVSGAAIQALSAAADWSAALSCLANLQRDGVAGVGPTGALRAVYGALEHAPMGWAVGLRLHTTASEARAIHGEESPVAATARTRSLVHLLARSGRWEQAATLVASDAAPSTLGLSVAVSLRAATFGARWDKALEMSARVVSTVPVAALDADTLAVVVRCCTNHHRWREALRVLQLSQDANVTLTAVAYAAVVETAVRAGHPALAQPAVACLLERFSDDPGPKAAAVNAMLSAAQDIGDARRWAKVLADQGLPVSRDAAAALVKALANGGAWSEALECMRDGPGALGLRAPGDANPVSFSSYTHAAVVCAMNVAGVDASAVEEAFELARQRGVTPTPTALKAAMNSCMSEGDMDAVQRLLAQGGGSLP